MEALLVELIAEVKSLRADLISSHIDIVEGLDLLCGVFYEMEDCPDCEDDEAEGAPAAEPVEAV